MDNFNPDAYLSSKDTGFNPDTYLAEKSPEPIKPPTLLERFKAGIHSAAQKAHNLNTGVYDAGLGAVKGASQIGATLIRPFESEQENAARRQSVTQGLVDLHANPESLGYKAGELGAEIAGTAGAGGAIAKGVSMVPKLAPLATAIESGGFTTGLPAANALTVQGAKNALLRLTGGAVSGGSMTGLVNPDQTGTGALIGAAIPVAGKLGGMAGNKLGEQLTASPAIVALADKAKNLGIDIPADRLVNSPALNAVSASLRYVPGSGRVATEDAMNGQIKKALSNTFGEDSEHITKDLIQQAKSNLGGQFDAFLKGNTVKVDPQLTSDLQANLMKAKNELSADNYRVIDNQVNDLLSKVNNGEIDGQAAYNVKKTLDRLGNGSGNEAYHAKQVRESLMDALKRSVSPDEAQAFDGLRRQYANMKTVEKLAGNTAEGDISMARLGNLDSKNSEVKDLSKIAATFGKIRENPHGAMQRVAMGGYGTAAALGGGALTGMVAPVAAGITVGRGLNTALNSQAVKQMILAPQGGTNKLAELLKNPATRALAAQATK